jgi:hypothetical protein
MPGSRLIDSEVFAVVRMKYSPAIFELTVHFARFTPRTPADASAVVAYAYAVRWPGAESMPRMFVEIFPQLI